MAVELAVVLPVILTVMVTAIDCVVYVSECARFDHLAAQSVLAHAVSPARGSYDMGSRVEEVRADLADEFTEHGELVTVSADDAGMPFASMSVFRSKLEYAPWPFTGGGIGAFGYSIPTRFEHVYALAVDPYMPGELL